MNLAIEKHMLFRLALSRYEQYGIEDEIMLKAIRCYVGITILEELKRDHPEYFATVM